MIRHVQSLALAFVALPALALASPDHPAVSRDQGPRDGRLVGTISNPIPALGTRARIGHTFRTRLAGHTEATGRNDGPVVDAVLETVGLKGSRAPYCAATNRAILDWSGFRDVGPRSAWSPDWLRNPTWTRAAGGRTPQEGDAGGIWMFVKREEKWRIGHTFLIGSWGRSVLTYEGNTSPDAAPGSAADRDGGGFHYKRRLPRQIHSVRDWISP